jgi:hypothetical protein
MKNKKTWKIIVFLILSIIGIYIINVAFISIVGDREKGVRIGTILAFSLIILFLHFIFFRDKAHKMILRAIFEIALFGIEYYIFVNLFINKYSLIKESYLFIYFLFLIVLFTYLNLQLSISLKKYFET